VLASAIAGIAKLAPGRVVLGIGRGDSSVRTLGLAASTLGGFERDLHRVQTFLSGEEYEGVKVPWLVSAAAAKVPIDVAASGPRVIALAAGLAERLTLAVGLDPDRIEASFDLARRCAPRT